MQHPGDPVERFKPTTGQFVGWTGVALCLVTIGFVAVDRHSLGGLRLGLAAAFAGVLIWATQLRPRVTAYDGHLLLHGSVRDTVIPYVAVNQVRLGQTLNVFVGDKRFMCVGIGRSVGMEMRQRVRSRGAGTGGGDFSGNTSYQFAGRSETTPLTQQGPSYAGFVESRITELVAAARHRRDREDGETPLPPVRHVVARAEVAGLLLTGTALVVSLLL